MKRILMFTLLAATLSGCATAGSKQGGSTDATDGPWKKKTWRTAYEHSRPVVSRNRVIDGKKVVEFRYCDTPEAVAGNMAVRRDDYAAKTTIESPYVNESGYAVWLQASIEDEDGLTQPFLVVKSWSEDARNFRKAGDLDGLQFRVWNIDTDIDFEKLKSQRYTEWDGVALTWDYLKERGSSGLDIKLFGENGNLKVKLPAHVVKGFSDATQFKASMASLKKTF